MGDITSTFYLYAKPSFIEGMGRVLDLGGNLEIYNESKTEKDADRIAIKNDWSEVGRDILSSIKKYEQK